MQICIDANVGRHDWKKNLLDSYMFGVGLCRTHACDAKNYKRKEDGAKM